MVRKNTRIGAALALLLGGLAACDGGSSSQGNQFFDDVLPTDKDGFNGGLVGRIISTYDDKPIQMDLASGVVSEVPIDTIQDWLARNDVGASSASDSSYFGVGGVSSSQYVQTVTECIPRDDNPLDYHACVAIYGADFSKLRNFRINDRELKLASKLSPTGQFLAFGEYYTYAGYKYASLHLLNLQGLSYRASRDLEVDESPNRSRAGASPIAWTPEESLVYTVPSDDRVVLYFTHPGTLTVANSIRLPALYKGEVSSLDVSPDGSKLLMGYRPFEGILASGVLLLDLNTLNITVPAVVQSEVGIVPLGDNIKGSIRAPRWSPDGQWIMVVQGRDEYFGPGVATSKRLFAVPANKSRTVLTTESPTDAIAIKVNYPDKSGFTESWSADTGYEIQYDWVN